jgi:iron(III) transport system substrate-binding protein
MSARNALLLLMFALILGVPLAMRTLAGGGSASRPRGADTIIVVTPHVAQLRDEFARGFADWYQRRTGKKVWIDWRFPGGTSEIIKQLEAVYSAAIKSGDIKPDGSCAPGTISFDLMIGGGSFDHGRLKAGLKVRITASDGSPQDVSMSMSVPAGFSQAQLDEWFGENKIGAQSLYDPEQHWIGTALSSFGIVYNRDLFRELGLPEPTNFVDLTSPKLQNWIALADPRQSGSINTSFDFILSNNGWEKGWRILRELSANTRYFTNSSTKPPIDVSAGEAAAGLAIDFYGRGQSQSVLRAGEDPETARVGYVDPVGAVYIDADPASMLRGGPNPTVARMFIEYTLTEEGQALWNFPSRRDPRSATNPKTAEGIPMGPAEYELRRMPIRRVMYAKYAANLIDKVDPFSAATQTKPAGWRSAIGPMMGAFGIDTAHEQRAAWAALNRARTSPNFPAAALAEMESLFYSWPTHELSDGSGTLDFNEKNYKPIREDWRKPGVQAKSEIKYTQFFRETYARIIRLESTRRTN